MTDQEKARELVDLCSNGDYRACEEAIALALSESRASAGPEWVASSVDPAGEQRALLVAFMTHPASAVMLWWNPGRTRDFDFWMEVPRLPPLSVHKKGPADV